MRLATWLSEQPDAGPRVRIDTLEYPRATGMSGQTLLFEASWDEPDGRSGGRFAVRLCPLDPFPIYPSYDIARQVRVMRLVQERSSVPVPAIRWFEPSNQPLGTPVLVMERVEGNVPPDLMPYPFDGSWVANATSEQRARLQAGTVDLLAAIHGVKATPRELVYLGVDQRHKEGSTLTAHFERERAYYEWVRGDFHFSAIERAYEWLEHHWPRSADANPPVICWGDARIGNIIYQDFQPRAVLDWELATLGPRELDLGWLIFLHRFFDGITTDLGMVGLPGWFNQKDVVAQYTASSGWPPCDLDWFVLYAAVRHASLMTRALIRSVCLSGRRMPDDPEDLFLHGEAIEALLDACH